MRVTIYWKGNVLFNEIKTTNFLMNIPLKQALKKIGWTNWWKIRRIYRCKPFKNDWSKVSKDDLLCFDEILKKLENIK